MSEYGDAGDPQVINQDAGITVNATDAATTELLERVQLLKQKGEVIETLHARFVEPNMHSGVATNSGNHALEGLSAKMKNLEEMMGKLLAPPSNNFATPCSSRFDRKPVLNRNNVPEPLKYNNVPNLPNRGDILDRDQGPTPQITLKDAIETVPNFNGHNIPIEQFARACNRAKALVPSQAEPQLARLLRNKLQDHACLAVEDRVLDSVNDLIKQLKRIFSPVKTSDHYRGELANIIKGTNEHILEYISRVKDLRFAILEEDRGNYRDFARIHPEDLDRLTLDSFVDGLPPPIRTRLLQNQFETLDDAFNLAALVDKEIERDHLRFSEQKTPRPTCQLCNKTGHDARSCRSNQNIVQQPFERYPPNRVTRYGNQAPNPLLPYWDITRPPPSRPTEISICSYCRKPGHLISECRRRIFNRNERKPRTFQERDSGNAPPLRSTMDAYRGTGQTGAHPVTIQPESGMSKLGSQQHG